MSTTSRWTAKLNARQALLKDAQTSVAYWARRAGSTHGRAMLGAMLEEAKARRALHVLARHPGAVTSVDDAGVALVAGFEGFRANVYRDPKGIATQGYGETQGLTPGKPWTRTYAATRLRARLNRDYLQPVLDLAHPVGLALTQNQADALASLVYNLGPGILDAGRTMGDALRTKNRKRIADAFLVYDEPNNPAVHQGLAVRRRAERALFLKD